MGIVGRSIILALACLTLLPAAARAQSAIAGVVKDATGAVLPGAAVEAASSALIERTRTVVTDKSGEYKIIDLRPGTYTLTFTLNGFATVKREEIELPSNFTATINADLRLGAVEETITVTSAPPMVDVTTNSKAQVLSRDLLDAVPTSHTLQSVGQLIVGVTLTEPDVGGSRAMQQTYFTVHGLGAAQTSVLMDGMIINGLQGDGAIQSYINEAGNQEMVYQTGGGTVDSPTGGVKINLVPREGGNQFHGSAFTGFESSGLQSSNLTSRLANLNVKTLDKIGTYRDIDLTQGGPIIKDTLWVFGSARFFTVDKPISNSIVSDGTPAGIAACQAALAGKGGALCPQGIDPQHQYSGLVRLTWQASPRNKLSAYIDRIHKVRGAAMTPGDDQTTSSVVWNSPLYMTNAVKWTSPVTNKLLLEGGYSSNIERYNNLYQRGLEQPAGSILGARHVDSGAGLTWGASGTENGEYPDRYNAQASASYVTGTHNIKVGFQDSWGHFHHTGRANADLYQNYNQVAGIETAQTVTLYATPARWEDSLRANLGIYGQDVWTLKRMTLTIGGRWEHVSEQVDGQPAQSGRWANIPAFSTVRTPVWNSFSPRTAVVYDVRGDGKTALKFGFNRFESAATTTLASLYNPANGTAITVNLPWTDLNHDDIAQGTPGCIYKDPGCEIDFRSYPQNFGTISLSTPDPKLVRPYGLAYNTGVTHEILSGMTVAFDWFHGQAKQILERNNTLRPGTYANGVVTNPSYRAVTVFSPIDGTPITVYDVTAAAGTEVKNVDSNDTHLSQIYNGFEFNFNARLPHGARIFGGSATDRTVANTCNAAATNPNFLVTIGGVNYCDQSKSGIPWRTQFKLAATYPLPWWGVTVSGSYQGLPGYNLGTSALTAGGSGTPNFTAFSGLAGTLTVTSTTKYTACPGNSASQGCVGGDPIAPGAISTLTVPLIPPNTLLTPRLNQVDFSIAKRITVGRFKLDPKIDIFNALNSDDYFTVRATTYTLTAAGQQPTALKGSSGAFLLPGSILQGRIVRLAAVVGW